MPRKALTSASIARMKLPASGQVDIFDKGFPGLYLRLSYGGTRAFCMAYRVNGGKQRRITLGQFPAMSLAAARERWREARKAIAERRDPTATIKADANNFAEIVADWLKLDQSTNRSHDAVKRLFDVDVLPY